MENTPTKDTPQLAPATVRYIKLGPGNAWFKSSLQNHRLEFGHPDIPDDLARSRDRSAITAIHLGKGRDGGKATGYAREVMEFYGLGEDCLWITFGDGAMWWAYAKSVVHMLKPHEGRASRYREVIGNWSNLDRLGRPLPFSSLSTRLTQVSAYRQTLCAVKHADAVVRRINAIEEPVVIEARTAQEALIGVVDRMIRNLHWRDFELLSDLIFARSGWQRIAELGGFQKDTDLVLVQMATGERAYVQVKSQSNQAEFNRYVENFEADATFDRMFYLCHSPGSDLSAVASKPVHVWTGQATARQAVAAGLFEWLMQKAG